MGCAHIEDSYLYGAYEGEGNNLIFTVSHDMKKVGKLHSRPAVFKCFRLRTLNTLQISLISTSTGQHSSRQAGKV